jgi:hypothetical protein
VQSFDVQLQEASVLGFGLASEHGSEVLCVLSLPGLVPLMTKVI